MYAALFNLVSADCRRRSSSKRWFHVTKQNTVCISRLVYLLTNGLFEIFDFFPIEESPLARKLLKRISKKSQKINERKMWPLRTLTNLHKESSDLMYLPRLGVMADWKVQCNMLICLLTKNIWLFDVVWFWAKSNGQGSLPCHLSRFMNAANVYFIYNSLNNGEMFVFLLIFQEIENSLLDIYLLTQ